MNMRLRCPQCRERTFPFRTKWRSRWSPATCPSCKAQVFAGGTLSVLLGASVLTPITLIGSLVVLLFAGWSFWGFLLGLVTLLTISIFIGGLSIRLGLIGPRRKRRWRNAPLWGDRKSTRLNSSHVAISYAVSC